MTKGGKRAPVEMTKGGKRASVEMTKGGIVRRTFDSAAPSAALRAKGYLGSGWQRDFKFQI